MVKYYFMLPAFLITFREVLEATLIVAAILSILIKFKQTRAIQTVWKATALATLVSFIIIGLGSLFGLKIQEIYSGKTEEFIEGILMISSAIFITWAVFFLHKYFTHQRKNLFQKIKQKVENEEQKGLFPLAFIAVFREGFEIALFLSTIYFSTEPIKIMSGFGMGLIGGITTALALTIGLIKLPISYAFKVTNGLLILFAAGLLARGVHEFAEAGWIPELNKITLVFIPPKTTFFGDLIKALFGITQHMDITQIILYSTYVSLLSWWVFFRKEKA